MILTAVSSIINKSFLISPGASLSSFAVSVRICPRKSISGNALALVWQCSEGFAGNFVEDNLDVPQYPLLDCLADARHADGPRPACFSKRMMVRCPLSLLVCAAILLTALSLMWSLLAVSVGRSPSSAMWVMVARWGNEHIICWALIRPMWNLYTHTSRNYYIKRI